MYAEAFLKDALFEFRRLKQQADRAIVQVTPEELFREIDPESNSVAVIMKHIAGNLRSRWTDFLTTDGEKPDRNRDSEFEIDPADTPESVKQRWEASWKLLFDGIKALGPEDLEKTVLIRGEKQTVPEAVLRQLTHYAGHIAQIIFLAKHLAGTRWQTLSIPRGKSEEYNTAMRQKLAEGYRSRP